MNAIPGPTPLVGKPGALFEIRGGEFVPVPLPQPDFVPLAIDADGRLIAGRTTGDRQVRRYRGSSLEATYHFRLEMLRSLAVMGSRVIVVYVDGRAQGIDENTVPRIDYTQRLNRRFTFVDARDSRVAFAGEEILICDWDGAVLEKGAGAPRVRLLEKGFQPIHEPGKDLAHDWWVAGDQVVGRL